MAAAPWKERGVLWAACHHRLGSEEERSFRGRTSPAREEAIAMSTRRLGAILLLMALSCFAQLNRGTITGTVTDTTGALIPQVRVIVTNTATNVNFETTTTEAGQYTVPSLPPGPYQVAFEVANFKRLVRTGLELNVAQVLRVDVSLEVGEVTQSVEVSAALPRVQTDSPEVGTVLPSGDLLDLPLGAC